MSSQSGKTVDSKITEIIESGDLSTLIPECENIELEYCSDRDNKVSSYFYASFLFGYLINNDLDNCRFLWKRIPKEIKKAEVAAVWKIGQALWQRDYTETYNAVKNFQWSQALKPLVDAFLTNLRNRNLNLIAKAYNSVSVSDLSVMLGMGEEEVIQHVMSDYVDFHYDQQTKYFTPNKNILKTNETTKSTGLDTISSLAKKTLFLELN
ncbi:COP9 signalosome complex subunit 8 [Acrasis kona]|uniref:COP9 signalosome complex subunit 8 n=1 Tax=Acrasis kona TaxID=1008807 RepID=A0AAW2ZCB0_9EUKA